MSLQQGFDHQTIPLLHLRNSPMIVLIHFYRGSRLLLAMVLLSRWGGSCFDTRSPLLNARPRGQQMNVFLRSCPMLLSGLFLVTQNRISIGHRRRLYGFPGIPLDGKKFAFLFYIYIYI